MDEHRRSYLALFDAVCLALEALEQQNYGEAKACLVRGQQEAEERFLSLAGPDLESPDPPSI